MSLRRLVKSVALWQFTDFDWRIGLYRIPYMIIYLFIIIRLLSSSSVALLSNKWNENKQKNGGSKVIQRKNSGENQDCLLCLICEISKPHRHKHTSSFSLLFCHFPSSFHMINPIISHSSIFFMTLSNLILISRGIIRIFQMLNLT